LFDVFCIFCYKTHVIVMSWWVRHDAKCSASRE